MADAFADHLARLLSLADLSGRLGGDPRVDASLGDVASLARIAASADRVSVFAVENADADADGPPSITRVARSVDADDGLRAEVELPVAGAGLLFSAIAGGSAVSLAPVRADEPFYASNLAREPLVPGAVAFVPISAGGRARGVLEAARADGRPFSTRDLAALEAASKLAAATAWLADRGAAMTSLFARLLPELMDDPRGSLRPRLEAWLAATALGAEERRAIALAGEIVGLAEASSAGLELAQTVLSAAARALTPPVTARDGALGRAGGGRLPGPPREIWAPLVGLGADAALAAELLESGSTAEVDELLARVTPSPGRDALAFAAAARRAERPDEIDALGRRAVRALEEAGDTRAAKLLDVERLSAAAAGRLDVEAEVRALAVDDDDAQLSAAVLRLLGSVARSRADLGASLGYLERARRHAEASGSTRELVRTKNTLGTSYASLGVAALARVELDEARELAELAGMRQSAAVASGQLAVLAMDADRPKEAARHLLAQLDAAGALGDTHGQARAHALLVEALSACGEPREASRHAAAARALYGATPSPWTALQAKLATAYEAEAAYHAGDRGAGRACEAALGPPTDGEDRLIRARRAMVSLAARGGEDVAGLAGDLAGLRASPRPVWVERALLAATSRARAAGADAAASTLAVRAACVLEARGAAGAPSLVRLRQVAEREAVERAAAIGRDLVIVARLALAPTTAFLAHALRLEGDGALARAAGVLAVPHPDDLLLATDGPRAATIVTCDEAAAAALGVALGAAPRAVEAQVVASALAGLSLIVQPR